jgi:hypothetical protein
MTPLFVWWSAINVAQAASLLPLVWVLPGAAKIVLPEKPSNGATPPPRP